MLTRVDLILLAPDGDWFVFRADGSRLGYVRLDLTATGADRTIGFDALVQNHASRILGVDVSYVGLLACERVDDTVVLVAVATVRPAQVTLPGDRQLRVLSFADAAGRGTDIDHAAHLVTARDWCRAAGSATDLTMSIQRAFTMSVAYLDSHLSIENGQWGWNQYQDGRSIGVLSTAEALLAHIYAGAQGEFVTRPAQTLEAVQNPDGGWRVRSSLIGGQSSLSIIESTAASLMALREAGRSAADPTIARGIAWLEARQRTDGGWSSSPADDQSMVFPTTVAVRALAGFGRMDAMTRGVSWLRHAQCPNGGWGASARATDSNGTPSAAYTGYAIVALLAAQSPATDPAVVAGCDHLIETFDAFKDEPWESTTANTSVDPSRSIRMDYRHFGTPWALTALSLAGHGLDEAIMLDGVRRLLALQQANGTWKCSVTAPESPPVWATHDAVLALRTVLRAGTRDLVPVAVARYVERDRRATLACLAHQSAWISGHSAAPADGRSRWSTALLSTLAVAGAALILWQGGVFAQLGSSSSARQAWAAVASIVLPVVSATIPAIVAEEHRLRRAGNTAGPGTQ
ncbi:prenyltransferase/squalene oxidase repeat-containing protein [Embleya sp. NPDC055664]|uniref:prenyltransferase/squalene oxidase repeat-containing protein n=1 Tax=Embleya sp. NPDC059237 TaxID=3346784 RepID=UPI003680127F